jgi:hypothetical protein
MQWEDLISCVYAFCYKWHLNSEFYTVWLEMAEIVSQDTVRAQQEVGSAEVKPWRRSTRHSLV